MNLSHDLKNIGLYHPARLHPKQNAYLMSFFFPVILRSQHLCLLFSCLSSTGITAVEPFPSLHITWASIGYLRKITDLMKKFRNTKLTNEINKFIVFPV